MAKALNDRDKEYIDRPAGRKDKFALTYATVEVSEPEKYKENDRTRANGATRNILSTELSENVVIKAETMENEQELI